MIYVLKTLIDITETGQHNGPNQKEVNQQANYNTVIQCLGLRANPAPLKTVSHVDSIKDHGFGTAFRGKQRYWECEFEIEYGDQGVEAFVEDFDFVPVITNLDETAKIDKPIFSTKDSKTKNTIILPYKD